MFTAGHDVGRGPVKNLTCITVLGVPAEQTGGGQPRGTRSPGDGPSGLLRSDSADSLCDDTYHSIVMHNLDLMQVYKKSLLFSDWCFISFVVLPISIHYAHALKFLESGVHPSS